jgi:ribosomal-protein-alanine N-acetyltransferase
MSVTLQTSRLTLRRIVASDEEVQVRHFAEPEAQKMILSPQRDSEIVRLKFRNALENIGVQEASGDHYFTVVFTATGEIVGSCSLLYAYEASVEVRLGWHISAKFCGRGFGTEMVKELLRFAFEDTQSSAATADCFSDNVSNIRVLEKAGMVAVRLGWLASRLLASRYGEKRPISRYALTREQWLSARREHNHVV